MKPIVFIAFCAIISLNAYCQGADKKVTAMVTHSPGEAGIQFDHEHAWAEILQKAKAENKLIYIDAYTTWCGPCKWMTSNVFNQQEVGEMFNSNFIAFKAQMDTSAADNEYIKAHYADFTAIATQYNVKAYPTHLFINGDGELVHKALGSKEVEKFISLGKNALNPDRQWSTLKKRFEAGERNPEFLFAVAEAAAGANEIALASEAFNLYIPTQKDFFTKENLELLFSATHSFDDKGFELIKNNRDKINALLGEKEADGKIMNLSGYLAYQEMNKNMTNPNFENIHTQLEATVSKAFADKVVASFKMQYYKAKKDWPGLKAAIEKSGAANLSWSDLNNYAWYFFENVEDKSLLQAALKWALLSVQKESSSVNNDTVANLYFKLGDKKHAIVYEEKALALAKQAGEELGDYEKVLKMFKGK